MTTRRKFIVRSTGLLAGIALSNGRIYAGVDSVDPLFPVVISTWNHGKAANEAAWKILESGGYALDAVEAGVRVPEADPGVISVGYGGLPDSEGKVTLDACIMNEKGEAGSVTYLQHVMHPVSLARIDRKSVV
jgi:N4-(beta-N-acetylglucosaminyl)-L-asparaginase